MKTISRTMVISGFIATSFIVFSSCEKSMDNEKSAQYASVIDVLSDGTTSVIETNVQSAFIETIMLTDSELTSLLKMKEEEKLARDVYSTLYQKWGSQQFARIILLLKYYGEADTLVNEIGVFTNTEIQTLYNTLIANASTSIGDAYKTGALIEEMDINDLNISLSNTFNDNIIMVFDNLSRGSRNHLRAFNRQLTSIGLSYTPVYISQADYDQIINSANEKGKQYKMNGKGKGQNNKGHRGKGDGNCN
jgi:hypothetical protein